MGSPHPSPSPPSPMQNPPGAVLSQGGPPLWALPRDRGQMPLFMIGKPRELGPGPKPSLEWLAPNLTGPFAWATPVHVEGGGALSGRGASLGPTTLKPFSHQLPTQWHVTTSDTLSHACSASPRTNSCTCLLSSVGQQHPYLCLEQWVLLHPLLAQPALRSSWQPPLCPCHLVWFPSWDSQRPSASSYSLGLPGSSHHSMCGGAQCQYLS